MLFYSRSTDRIDSVRPVRSRFLLTVFIYLFILWRRGRAGLVVVAVVVMGGMYVCLWGRRSVANGHGCGTSHQQNHNCLRNKTTIIQYTINEKAF